MTKLNKIVAGFFAAAALIGSSSAQQVLRSQTVSYDNYAALEAVPFVRFQAGAAVIISASGKAGTFIKVTSNETTLRTADPQKCVFIPSPQDATGASGGYLRKEWLDSKIVRLEWCGGIPDDGNDDTTALNAFFSLVSSQHTLGQMGKGEFEFSTALTRVATDNWTVEGAGGYATTLRYTGASTTADLITLGDNSLGALVRLPGNTLRNFRIASDTTMTAGAAIKIEKLMQYVFDGIVLEGWAYGTNYNLYDGLYTVNSDWGTMVNGDIRTSNSGVVATSGAELRLDNMQIVGTGENAIHIGGGFGGFYTGYVGIFGQNVGIRVDTAKVAAGNNQIFISNETAIDNCVAAGVYINDPISSNKSFNFEAWSSSQSDSFGNAFAIVNWANGDVNITGAKFLSNAGNGIYLDDPSAHVFIDSTTVVAANGQVGIYVNQATSNLYSLAVPYNNTAANTGGFYTSGGLTGAFTAPVTISGTDTTKFTMTTTDATSNSGPVIVAVRDSASPAASDVMGAWLSYGKDSGNNLAVYAGFDTVILDPTDTSEDGEIRFNTMTAGTYGTAMGVANGVAIGAAGFNGSGTLNVQTSVTAPTLAASTTITSPGATFSTASTNSTSILIGNTAASGRNWALFSSGGGPAAAGTFGMYDSTGGALRLAIAPDGGVYSGGASGGTKGADSINMSKICTSGKCWTSASTAPATCSIGELFTDTDGGASTTLYVCTATNTWTAK